MLRLNRTHRIASSLVALALLVPGAMQAATLSADAHPGYKKLNFAFPAPAQLKATHSGTTITLNFNQVLGLSSADIKAQLGDNATSVTESTDGKTLILTMKQPVNIRQFSNGKTVGVDIIGLDPDPATPAKTGEEAAPFKHAAGQEPVSAKARATTVKAAPIATVEQGGAAGTNAANDIYTTKKTTPTPTTVAAKPHKTTSLLVTARKNKEGFISINFPWEDRTAAAIFERQRTIWIFFSHEADPHLALLSTVLPKQIVRVQQYAYPGALVLRLTTDGTLHAVAGRSGSNYEWNVILTPNVGIPLLDTPITPDVTGTNHSVLLGVFDVAPPLQFFDPVLQDKLIVIPTFETSRGVAAATARTFPEFTILSTQQGVVVTSQRDDLIAEALRQGIRISAPKSLAVSENLPLLSEMSAPIHSAGAASNVMIPYDQWYVAPVDFARARLSRLGALAKANSDTAPDTLLQLVRLYLGQGFAEEAVGYLDIMKQLYPEYYVSHKLALLSGVCNAVMQRLPEAMSDFSSKELDELEEAKMWREFVASLLPTPPVQTNVIAAAVQPVAGKSAPQPAPGMPAAVPAPMQAPEPPPMFDYMHYSKSILHFYPPRIRQAMLLQMADSENYEHRENSLLTIFNVFSNEGFLSQPFSGEAEMMLAKMMMRKEKDKDKSEALKMLDHIASENANQHAQTEARFNAVMLRYQMGQLSVDEATAAIEHIRLSWHGDRLEREMLRTLAQIYLEHKQYASTLRTWKYMLDAFPAGQDVLKLSADLSELFERLFLGNEADTMPPLESLATFYEFRELTPVGERGDLMIQKLADRLAGVDLIDRATQLLQNQIKFRLQGEARARVGARLAVLLLINQQPQEALNVIETTNFTGNIPLLQIERAEIAAKALSALNRSEEALAIIATDRSPNAGLLRLEIYWASKDWPNVINQAEDILGSRQNLTAPLNPQETDILLKLVLGYAFEGDHKQLKYLRDYYSSLLTDSAYKQIFDYLTNDTTPLDTEDFALVTAQISHTESFLGKFKQKIAQGKLSEAVK